MPRRANLLTTRRQTVLGLSASSALLATTGLPALAGAPMQGPIRPQVRRFQLGAFEVTTILDGTWVADEPHTIFGEDQEPADVAALAEAHFLPADKVENPFVPTLINTGNELVLFDTGNGEARRPERGHLRALLAAAGYTPEQVDIVVLTHFHGDHIGGLMEGGAPAFANARYITNAAEYDFWSARDDAELVQTNVVPLAEQMSFIKDGEDVVSGVTAMAAFGHTPGHTIYHVESDGRRLLLLADTTNHYVLSLSRPQWHVRFDMDKDAAIATRERVLDMLAAERIPFVGYHMPFPGIGFVDEHDGQFAFVPTSYQLNL